MRSAGMEATIKTGQSFLVNRTDQFERNDIVLFNYYGPDYSSASFDNPGQYKMSWEKRVYRIIACSGDEVEIKDDEVFLNKRHIAFPPLSQLNYEIKSSVLIDELENNNPSLISKQIKGDTIIYITPLTISEASDFRQRKPAIFSVEKQKSQPAMSDTNYARPSANYTWSSSNYGPLKIPLPGDTVIVNNSNFKLYKNIPGIKAGKNIISEKLYFVLGDNRCGAEDSRFIGFIPHSNMYGIAK